MENKNSLSKIATKKNAQKVGKKANEIGSFIIEHKTPLLLIGGALLGWYILKKTKEGVADIFADKSESVPIDLTINKATISKTQAQQFAQQLLDASNHMEPLYGTDEQTIEKVFLQLKKADDFKLIYQAFGQKNYNGNNSPPTGIFRHIDNYEPRDLVYWLKSELSPADGKVYTLVKERIESAGWQF